MCTHACCQNVREMRQGCYGALQGRHSFTAFILLNLHKESAERVMFSSFHRVCNTLKVIYYHFLGHTINFSKTFNGRAYDAASSNAEGLHSKSNPMPTNSSKSKAAATAKDSMARESIQLHVFFYDGAAKRRAWDLLPGETVGADTAAAGAGELLQQEWRGVSERLVQLMKPGRGSGALFRHRWCAISTSPEPNMINSAVRGACRAACRLAAHV